MRLKHAVHANVALQVALPESSAVEACTAALEKEGYVVYYYCQVNGSVTLTVTHDRDLGPIAVRRILLSPRATSLDSRLAHELLLLLKGACHTLSQRPEEARAHP